jgi:hypothetical protein
LRSAGLVYNSDYSYQQRYHKGQFIYLVFLNSALFHNITPNKKFELTIKKYFYKNFAQFCNQSAAQLYNSNQRHLYNN